MEFRIPSEVEEQKNTTFNLPSGYDDESGYDDDQHFILKTSGNEKDDRDRLPTVHGKAK